MLLMKCSQKHFSNGGGGRCAGSAYGINGQEGTALAFLTGPCEKKGGCKIKNDVAVQCHVDKNENETSADWPPFSRGSDRFSLSILRKI